MFDTDEWKNKLPKDWNGKHVMFNPDQWKALSTICIEEDWIRSRIIDSLIASFLNDYRQMWPVSGMMQMSLSSRFDKDIENLEVKHKPELPPAPVLKVSTQNAHVLKNPDYYSKAWPDIGLLRSLAKDYKWDTEAEQRLRDIAANTKEESTRTNIEMQLQQWKERLTKKPQDLIRK